MFRTMRWRVAVPYVLLILAAMALVTAYVNRHVRDLHLDALQRTMLAQAGQVSIGLGVSSPGSTVPSVPQVLGSDWQSAADYWSQQFTTRVTIIDADGSVLGDSHASPSELDNHLARSEVQQALTQGQGISTRYSRTLGYTALYVAVPYPAEGEPAGVVRLSLSMAQVSRDAARVSGAILGVALLATGVAVLLAVGIASRITVPIRHLVRAASHMADGDLSARAVLFSDDEVGRLGMAFNRMAEQLQMSFADLGDERQRSSAILEHMADGVLFATDAGVVRLINPAACRLLGTTPERALGRTYAQLVRHHEIINLWRDSVRSGGEREGTVELDRQGTMVRVIVTPVRAEAVAGRLVILQDLTVVRRAEIVRRDFVSNASHELRTPLASLKALVETLRDGALDDPPAAQHFLDRVESEVDALTQMVQELLELSRIESSRESLRLGPTSVSELVTRTLESLRALAQRAGLTLEAEPMEHLPLVEADSERVRHVLTNLVHNAIKFTPPGGRVWVTAHRDDAHVVVAVHDNGVGIPSQDLERIFERFYKTDPSRRGGGTGLGLAIARHIVQAHGGRIWVESQEGQGSVFLFTVPVAPVRMTLPPSAGA